MSMLAIISVGGVSVSLNALWVEDEIDYALADCGASLLIADDERIGDRSTRAGGSACACSRSAPASPSADDVDQWNDVVVPGPSMPAVDVGWDDDATILYTSGTTGRPKGAVSTNGAIVSSVMAFGSRAAADVVRAACGDATGRDTSGCRPRRSFILIVPLFHVTGCVPVLLSCVVLEVEAGDDVPLERGEGAGTDRARAGHQLHRRADAELGPRQLAAVRGLRHVEPARRRRRWCACADSAGRARRREREERRSDPGLRHDRDQCVRPEQHGRRLRRASRRRPAG